MKKRASIRSPSVMDVHVPVVRIDLGRTGEQTLGVLEASGGLVDGRRPPEQRRVGEV
jgi:hypothetical protein